MGIKNKMFIVEMDKTLITIAFNKILFEFFDEIIQIVPENGDIKNTRIFLKMMQMMNAQLIIKLWYKNLYEPYRGKIENNDLSFFIDKEYQDEASSLPNAREVLQGIDKLREPIRNMSSINKETSMKFIQKLSKLSQLYNDGVNK
jgi:hypothetical protein